MINWEKKTKLKNENDKKKNRKIKVLFLIDIFEVIEFFIFECNYSVINFKLY